MVKTYFVSEIRYLSRSLYITSRITSVKYTPTLLFTVNDMPNIS